MEPEPTSMMDEFGEWARMSRKQRLIGFVGCLCVGFLIDFASWFCFFSPIAFAVLFTFGNLVSMCSTMFLCGPKKQFTNMTDKTRLGTTIVYVTFMILTLVMALKIKTLIGTVICCFIQWLALIWYGLSYIPFARAAVTKMLQSATGV